MLKAMLFVDADWLCASTLDLDGSSAKPDLQIDPRRMNGLLADEIGRRNQLGSIDVVRSLYFASRTHGDDGTNQALVQRRREFLARMDDEPRVELEVVDVELGARSIGNDGLFASAPTVHVAMAVAAMRYALTPGVLDLAIFVLGDRSFVPLLQELRRIGRRVALVSVEGSCAADLADSADPHGARDFEVLWLGEVLGRIEKWRGRRPARPGEEDSLPSEEEVGASLRGRIKNVIWDRGYGFIAAEDGRDYFFHVNALEAGLEFDELQPDLAVSFEVKSGPLRGRAGAARLVRRAADVAEAAPATEPEEGRTKPPEAEAGSAEPPEAEASEAEQPLPDQAAAEEAIEPPRQEETPVPADAEAEEGRS